MRRACFCCANVGDRRSNQGSSTICSSTPNTPKNTKPSPVASNRHRRFRRALKG